MRNTAEVQSLRPLADASANLARSPNFFSANEREFRGLMFLGLSELGPGSGRVSLAGIRFGQKQREFRGGVGSIRLGQ